MTHGKADLTLENHFVTSHIVISFKRGKGKRHVRYKVVEVVPSLLS